MPKIIGYTPPWLSRPSPGARIFSDPAPESPASPSKRSSYAASQNSSPTGYQGPKRIVANRGTEVFTVVGNKIRWADLSRVKDDWEDNNHSRRGRATSAQPGQESTDEDAPYRTLITPVYYQIRQLVISPSGTFLAICTEHTVHVAVLPDPSRLVDHDRSSLKLKTYQLGPTTHVIPESPLATVLWHPLAAATPSTDCLVTVTSEAAVRVWELDRSNHWSFERPALAIDLRKLADGVSCDQDFEPSGFGKNRGFSVDDFDMEVAAACFGGSGMQDEDAWASMTLWTAMRNGDIYALCPLLPSRWQPSATTSPSLSTSAVSRMATIAGEDVNEEDRRAADQQYEWVQEIDNDEPLLVESPGSNTQYEMRVRPQNPSAIPRLQGPFEIQLDDEDEDFDVSDICVFATQLDETDLFSGEDDYDGVNPSVPFTTLCLATTNNLIHIALDLEGVSGQWLPKKGRSTFGVPSSDTKELSLVETLSVKTPDAEKSSVHWPILTLDPTNKYSVFLTTSSQIYSISLADWTSRLAMELAGDKAVDPGLKTRLETSCQHQVLTMDEIISAPNSISEGLSAPTVIDDSDLGYLLLTTSGSIAYAVTFDQVHLRMSFAGPSSPELASVSPDHLNRQLVKITEDENASKFEPLPTRAPYAPPNVLYNNPMLPIDQMKRNINSHLRKSLSEKPMRLSPACLDIMASAHRTISAQTSEIEVAAAELFRKCERLRKELIDQVKQMSELADRLQHMHSLNGEATEERKTHDERIKLAQEKQKNLIQRYETLRRKAGRVGSANQKLSPKELSWVDEIEMLGQHVGLVGEEKGAMAPLLSRFETVKQVAQEFLDESRKLENQQSAQDQSKSTGLERSDSTSRRQGSLVSSRLQKEKIADVMAMVEREGAVIEAVMARLDKLNVEN